MRYWNYYWLLMLASFLLQQPKLLVGLLLLLLLRRVLPAPGPILRALRKGGSLRRQLQLNPKNATAARDLAELELALLRPRAALRWLELGLARSPDEAELLYLSGLALHRLGQQEQALTRLVAAEDKNARVRFGLAYLTAGDALSALQRWTEALDAYERYLDINSSDLRGYLGMARAYHRLGDRAAAVERVHEALRTYRMLPHHLRAANRRPRLRAFWLKVWMLREPKAIAQALALGVLCAVGLPLASLVVFGTWQALSNLEEPDTELAPERCEALALHAAGSVAHRACLAKAVTFQHSYLDPPQLDADIARLRELGIAATPMQGAQSREEGAPHYVGYQLAIAGSSEARFIVYNEVLRHRFLNADFVDTVLKPPLRIVEDSNVLQVEGADGARRTYVRDQEPCLDLRDASVRDASGDATQPAERHSAADR